MGLLIRLASHAHTFEIIRCNDVFSYVSHALILFICFVGQEKYQCCHKSVINSSSRNLIRMLLAFMELPSSAIYFLFLMEKIENIKNSIIWNVSGFTEFDNWVNGNLTLNGPWPHTCTLYPELGIIFRLFYDQEMTMWRCTLRKSEKKN